jgi:hypothetical protein
MPSSRGARISSGSMDPANGAFAITPHDTNELAMIPRALYIGGSGNLVVVLAGDTVAVTFTGLIAGAILPIRPKIVKSASTTATYILGLV